MAKVRTSNAFDLDVVAAVFPGQLTFRGAPAGSPRETEIEGEVPEPALIQAVEFAVKVFDPDVFVADIEAVRDVAVSLVEDARSLRERFLQWVKNYGTPAAAAVIVAFEALKAVV